MKNTKLLRAASALCAAVISFNAAAAEKRALIAYFTWAENTVVSDPSSVNPDAISAASLLMPGNVGLLASWIAESTGADLFSIKTAVPYPSDYEECLKRAAIEHDNGILPELTAKVANLDEYDVIYLGYPNWWYSCPQAVLKFIEENDLSGKTVVPFCAHGTGGLAASIRDIRNALPEGTNFLDSRDDIFHVSRRETSLSKDALEAWLEKIAPKL